MISGRGAFVLALLPLLPPLAPAAVAPATAPAVPADMAPPVRPVMEPVARPVMEPVAPPVMEPVPPPVMEPVAPPVREPVAPPRSGQDTTDDVPFLPPGGQAASPDAPHPGETLRVEVLTMGQGELVWEKFGHNAIRIVDTRDGTDIAWNWGMFTFTQQGFWPRLVRGEMLYSMGAYPTETTLRQYERADRWLTAQELDMTAAQKWRLLQAVLEHYRPENRDYLYDYYRDNCSTRVRDMLDLALDGALSDAFRGDTTRATYRWHTRRLLGASPLAYTGIQLVLGVRADRPITRWEEGFLPMRLQEQLREVTVTGPDGRERPLVRSETRLVGSDRPATPQEAPSRLGAFGLLGVALAAVVAGLAAWAARGSAAGRALFVGVASLWSFAAGSAGALLLGAWLFTAHHFWGANENLLQADPLSLVLAFALVPVLWRGRPGSRTALLAAAVAGLSVLGFVAQALPGVDQVNGEIIALALPVHVAVAWAVRTLAVERPPEPGDRAAAAAAVRAA